MHEALVRAVQDNSPAVQYTVAPFQSERVTRHVYEASGCPLPTPSGTARPGPPASPGRTLLWPYPRGSADTIDRANCAELFLRAHPGFRVVTEDELDRDALAAAAPSENLILFCPFEAALPRLSIAPDSTLAVDGRPVDAVASEMIVGYLMRAGRWPKPTQGLDFRHIPAIDRLRTGLVNGTGLALFKAAQLKHFDRHRQDVSGLRVTVPRGCIGWDRATVLAASQELLARGEAVVYRPFGSSRSAGVSFLSPRDARGRREAVEDVLDAMEAAMADHYGQADPYPITLSTLVQARPLDGRQCELRMFVVADPSTMAVRAIPGMVCLTPVPFGERVDLAPSNSLTASLKSVAVPGHREFPLSDPDVLTALDLDVEKLERLGRFAALLWSRAITAERAATGLSLPFAFGSVDFLLAQDGRVAPLEMNGANVAGHRAVHPTFLDAFGIAMRAALEAALR